MENRGRRRLRGVAVLAAFAAVAVTAAVWTGSSAASSKADANPFAHYGNITLNVWSADNQDPGPEPVIKALAASFSKKYPNVTIKLKFYSFTSYIKIIKLSLNSSNAPDVAEGNQGFQIDSALVKAKLIKPLDSYAAKYGWNKQFSAGTAQQFRWTPDGNTFGKGNLWGVAQFGQSTGVFYNKALLKKYGGDPNNMPKTFADFRQAAGETARERAIERAAHQLGNKDGYEALHAFGMVQGAYVERPVHAQLDLPRPQQRLRSGCQRQSADDVPEVVQGRLLRQQLQRARREDRLGRVRQGHGRLLPRRQLAGRGHPERPQEQRRVHEHAARPERRSTLRSAPRACPGTSRRRRSMRMSARPSSTG